MQAWTFNFEYLLIWSWKVFAEHDTPENNWYSEVFAEFIAMEAWTATVADEYLCDLVTKVFSDANLNHR